MDHIYSRKRIRFCHKPPKKVIYVVCVILIAIGTIFHVVSGVNPVFNTLSENKAREIATNILNHESSKVLENVKYDEFVTIVKDKEEKIKLLQINTVKINLVASEIAYNIEQELSKKERFIIKK